MTSDLAKTLADATVKAAKVNNYLVSLNLKKLPLELAGQSLAQVVYECKKELDRQYKSGELSEFDHALCFNLLDEARC